MVHRLVTSPYYKSSSVCGASLHSLTDLLQYLTLRTWHLRPFHGLLSQGVSCAMQHPEDVKLSREDGEALRQRLDSNALTADDRRVLGQVLQWYFWLLFAVQEARFSLKRLRALLFGE